MASRISVPSIATGSRVLGLGSHRPQRIVMNEDFAARLATSDEWIRQRTGITERRFARDDETVIDMGILAGVEALEDAGVAAADIDAVIVTTCTLTPQIPNAAARVAHALGATRAGAFDVNAACAGFCYGLAIASDFVRAGSASHVLVVAAEKLTDIVDGDDVTTAIIFADGAGAAVVGPSESPGIGPVAWGHVGSRPDVLAVRNDFLQQDGQAIFKWAIGQLPKTALEAVRLAGLAPGDVDAVVSHQANLRIIRAAARELRAEGFRDDVVVADDVQYSGNTSAASIPLALHALRRDGRVTSGDVVVTTAVGAGLTWAGQALICP